ncbi:hypothetical protein JDV02_008887 [Purpureocillium takamizusanense]|uniref:Uncharacterized protein n=1 Tax=Purpureocillium takamizusanense TaxID=2060973 RepID=A0A9Q8VFL8_9HYPO|nr:uncharacterized protein JDV02_008887 [Purpureocillium takamizusanense]UNI23044.1 hypothetical protein JDV02_008887 [Purpureocillium takamizusanense]
MESLLRHMQQQAERASIPANAIEIRALAHVTRRAHDQLEADYRKLRADYHSRHRALRQREEEVSGRQAVQDALRGLGATLTTVQSGLGSALSGWVASYEAMSRASRIIEADRTLVDAELGELRRLREEALQRDNRATSALQDLERRLEDAEAREARLQEEKTAAVDEAAAKTTVVQDLQQRLADAETREARLQEEKAKATKETAAKATVVQDLQRRLADAEAREATLQQERTAASEEAATKATALEDRDAVITGLQRRLTDAGADQKRLQEEAAAQATALGVRDQDVARLEGQVKAIADDRAAAVDELRRVREDKATGDAEAASALKARDDQVAKLRGEVHKARGELDKARGDANAESSELRRLKDQAVADATASKAEARQLKREVDVGKALLEAVRGERDVLVESLHQERSNAETTRRAVDEAARSREAMDSSHAEDIAALQGQLNAKALELLHAERRENSAVVRGQHLEDELVESRSAVDDAEKRVKELLAAAEQTSEDLREAHRAIKDLKTAAKASHEAYGIKNDAATRWEGRATLLEQKLETARGDANVAEGRCSELQKQLDEERRQKSVAEQGARDAGVAGVEAMLRTSLERFMSSVPDTARVRAVEGSLLAAQDENNMLEAQLNEAARLREDAANTAAQLEVRVGELEAENQGLLQHVEEQTARPPSPRPRKTTPNASARGS